MMRIPGWSARRGPAAPPRPSPVVRSPYQDARLYDLLFEGYRGDLDFYLARARAAGGPVLDLACGTGRVMIPALEAGVDIEGLDAEPGMLAALARKARARGLEPRLHPADMRRFALPRRFALILSPFNALVHNLSPEDWLSTLRACRQHLLPGGALLFDVQTMGPAALCEPDGVPVRDFEVAHDDAGLTLRVLDTRWKDVVAQTQRSVLEVQEADAAGRVAAAHRFETTMRWAHRNEMALMLALAGFARWEISGGFAGEPLRPDSIQMVVQAWTAAT